jgi:acyl carrier protein
MPFEQTPFEKDIASLLVESLKLDIAPEDIEPEALLFGDAGLGLDSIDVLEIAFALSKHYGVTIKSDDSDNINIFKSLKSLSAYVETHQKRVS